MNNNRTIPAGDWSQILELRKQYNYLLQLKENFVDMCSRENLTAKMVAEAEVSLIKITAQVKAADSAIYALMFGDALAIDAPAESLRWNVERQMKSDVKGKYFEAKRQNKLLTTELEQMKASREYYRKKVIAFSSEDNPSLIEHLSNTKAA